MATTSNQIHSLFTPDNCALVLIDFQPQMAFATKSIDGQTLVNNAVGLAKGAKIFNVPTILTTVRTSRRTTRWCRTWRGGAS